MAYTPKDGYGALLENDKGDNANRPDYRGDICINGEMYELAGWLKPMPSDASKRYMSISAKPKQKPQAAQQNQAPRNAPQSGSPRRPDATTGSRFADMDDDIPF